MSKPLDFKSLTVLAKFAANSNNANTCFSFNDEKYSCEQVNETLRRELNKYALDYNTFQETKECILSIENKIDTNDYKIVIVDNKSNDDRCL